LRWLEELLIQTLAVYEISAGTRPGLTGVWVDKRKIASIGVGVRHWITMHGFALNVCGDLAPFARIIPCGIQGVTMTSIEKETGRTFSPEEVSHRVTETAFHSITNLTTEGALIQISRRRDNALLI
jgi:lipoate-protein ligase B